MNNEVEEGYINVTAQTDTNMADSYGTYDRRQVSASTSSASGTSSHRIHTRETTADYTSDRRISSSQDASYIRRLQAEIEWLYDRNAELQEDVENLKADATSKEREYRQATRRLQTEVDTLQNALDDAERQNRALEATVKHLKMQKPESRGGGIQPVHAAHESQGCGHSRSDPIEGIPASSSVTDSLTTSNSANSDYNLHSGSTGERNVAGTHQDLGTAGNRQVRKKVSWQDEVGGSTTLLSRPAPPPINVPGVGLPIAGIIKTSPNHARDCSSPRSPPSLQAYHLTPALPSVSEWVRTHPGGQRSTQRRASETPSPGPARSLFEELKGAGQMQPSVSQMSSMSGHSTLRHPKEAALEGSDSFGDVLQSEAGPGDGDGIDDASEDDEETATGAAERTSRDATIIDRCTAVLEDRGNDFWQRVQFYCIVGIFLAGVLSKGRDGVMELGRRR